MTTEIPGTTCPACGIGYDATTGLTEADVPKPGDVTVCFYCAYVACFDDDLQIVRLPRDRATAILSNPDVRAAQEAIRRSHR